MPNLLIAEARIGAPELIDVRAVAQSEEKGLSQEYAVGRALCKSLDPIDPNARLDGGLLQKPRTDDRRKARSYEIIELCGGEKDKATANPAICRSTRVVPLELRQPEREALNEPLARGKLLILIIFVACHVLKDGALCGDLSCVPTHDFR